MRSAIAGYSTSVLLKDLIWEVPAASAYLRHARWVLCPIAWCPHLVDFWVFGIESCHEFKVIKVVASEVWLVPLQ